VEEKNGANILSILYPGGREKEKASAGRA